MKYADLPEDKKEKIREAGRKWRSKNDRSEYYRDYYRKKSPELKARHAEVTKAWLERNPEKRAQYSKATYGRQKKEYKMWWAAKKRCNKSGLEFSLEREDVVVPETCECCSQPMLRPSLDRVDNTKGYTKENTKVICWNCNCVKNQGDAELHRKIAEYIDRNIIRPPLQS